jgi:hypothetical protein
MSLLSAALKGLGVAYCRWILVFVTLAATCDDWLVGEHSVCLDSWQRDSKDRAIQL